MNQGLFSQVFVVNIDTEALVEARCSGGTGNGDRILYAIFKYRKGVFTNFNNFAWT